ncbi:MAG: metallophosphoesterase family protein [Pirellulales bacterium]|nr:metallophosphoesterase family protein [Pirellulales bacterium]
MMTTLNTSFYTWFAIGWLALPVCLSAHEGPDHKHPPARPVAPRELYRPTAAPDRVILTLAADPARAQGVTWRTSTEVAQAKAQILPAEHGPIDPRKAANSEAVTTPLATDLGDAHYHSVLFADLQPRTKYAYRVGDGINWSEWFHFTTAADKPEPFSFIYFGDAQNDIKSQWSRVVREAYGDMPDARFMLHAGDLINNPNSDAEWGEWFFAGGWLNGSLNTLPTPGNHEYGKKTPLGKSELSGHWRAQFTLPENGPANLPETAYFIDYQGTRIISLNSNEQQAEQAAWLEKTLADHKGGWKIVTFHHPIYSPAQNRDNPVVRKHWQPLFDKYGVDLVLQGHDHTYARTGVVTMEDTPVGRAAPQNPAQAKPAEVTEAKTTANGEANSGTGLNYRSPAGTVYVVSVSGPKMYGLGVENQKYFTRIGENTQLYQLIHIDGSVLRFEARTARGDLYDGFTLTKREGRPNELVEEQPEVAERRLEK